MSETVIRHRRDIFVETYTMGELTLLDRRIGWTLEDPMRERIGEDGRYYWRPEFKIDKRTAIPFGRYRVIASFSQRFQRILPEILGVPDFTGIRAHGGNTVENTDGCPLCGVERDVTKGRVWNCAPVVDALTSLIEEANRHGPVFWEIVR